MHNKEALREKCKRSFNYFCRLIQDEGYIFKVHDDLAEFLQYEVMEKGKTNRGLVLMPRGSMKTTFATKFFPLWLAVRDPNVRILIVSNTMPNAKLKISEIRSLVMEHPVFTGLFPELLPDMSKDPWSDERARLSRPGTFSESTFEAAGTRSRLTGRHYDWIIEDDTVAPELSDLDREVVLPSRKEINQAIGWHKLATPLLNDAYTGGRLVVGTRWCHDDLIEFVQKNEINSYKQFSRAAKYNGKPIVDKFDQEALDDIKETLGSYMFSALYLNEPVRPEDMIFRPEWIVETDEIPINIPGDEEDDPDYKPVKWVITVDPAISESDDACDTAIVRAGHLEGKIYVDSCLTGKYTPKQTIEKVLDLVQLDAKNTAWIGIESVAYQKALALFLRDEMNRRQIYRPVQEIKSRKNKHVRIQGLQPFFERKQIIIRTGLKVLISQLTQYPHGKLLDAVDALAMQLDSYRGERKRKKLAEAEHPIDYEYKGPTLEDVMEKIKKKNKGRGILRSSARNSQSLLRTRLR